MDPHLYSLIYDTRANPELTLTLAAMSLEQRDAACAALILQRGSSPNTPQHRQLLGDSTLVEAQAHLPGTPQGTLEHFTPISSQGRLWLAGTVTGHPATLTAQGLSHDRVQTAQGLYHLGVPRDHDAACWHAALHGSRFDEYQTPALQPGDSVSVQWQGGLYPATVQRHDWTDFIITRHTATGDHVQEAVRSELLRRHP